VRSSENMKCPLLAMFKHVTIKVHKLNIFTLKTSSACSNVSLKTWTSLPDCFVNDQLIIWLKSPHSLIKCDFSWVTSSIWVRYTSSCSFARSSSLTGLLADQRVGAMKSGDSWVNRVLLTLCSACDLVLSMCLVGQSSNVTDLTPAPRAHKRLLLQPQDPRGVMK